MENTSSDASATARGDSLNSAPWLSRFRATSRRRSWTARRWPALIRLAAIPPPMPPVPIKPRVPMRPPTRRPSALFDDFIRLDQHRLRYREPKVLRGFEIDQNLEF